MQMPLLKTEHWASQAGSAQHLLILTLAVMWQSPALAWFACAFIMGHAAIA